MTILFHSFLPCPQGTYASQVTGQPDKLYRSVTAGTHAHVHTHPRYVLSHPPEPILPTLSLLPLTAPSWASSSEKPPGPRLDPVTLLPTAAAPTGEAGAACRDPEKQSSESKQGGLEPDRRAPSSALHLPFGRTALCGEAQNTHGLPVTETSGMGLGNNREQNGYFCGAVEILRRRAQEGWVSCLQGGWL